MAEKRFAGWPVDFTNDSKYALGDETLAISRSMHIELRKRTIDGLKSKGFTSGIVFVRGGASRCREDTDHEELFRQESNFHYLFGVVEPDCYGTIDVASGSSTLFIPRLPDSYAVWMGKIASPEEFKKLYGLDGVFYVDQLSDVFKTNQPSKVFVYSGVNSDSGSLATPASFDGIAQYEVDDKVLHEVIYECRVTKSEEEIEVIKYTNRISSEAHIAVMQQVSLISNHLFRTTFSNPFLTCF